MKNINWFVIMILGVWLIAGLTCLVTKNTDPISNAATFSIIAGMGYVFYKG